MQNARCYNLDTYRVETSTCIELDEGVTYPRTPTAYAKQLKQAMDKTSSEEFKEESALKTLDILVQDYLFNEMIDV
eukprot:372174-Ditylum_brightwellii.AAC.1